MKKILIIVLFLLLPFCFAQAGELSERLKGKILLQVESNGEAWYVNPDSQNRFYLGRPADAFSVMREQGLGVSNNDFDTFAGTAPERLAGKILLKVESNGEAYYVNPIDFTMHYLGRPVDAFDVMRNLGLGITNSNLELVEIDENSTPVITEEVIEEPPYAEATEGEEVIEETEEVPDLPAQAGETATSTEDVIGEETATSTEEVIEEVVEEVATTTCTWLAEYFDNKSLFGSPVATKTVEAIDFDWGIGGPEELNKINTFSARFTANCYFEDGTYEFQTVFDDAIKVYLDNTNFLQSWADNNKTKIFNRERMVDEGEHEVKVEYYDASGKAKIYVDWIKI